MPEVEVGRVSDFFAHPMVAGIELTNTVKLGNTIHIVGHTTDAEMVVESMQVNKLNISETSAGQAIGIKVPDRVRHVDTVFKVNG